MELSRPWWTEYPRPASPMARAAERMELAAEMARMKDEDYARARHDELDRAWRLSCQVSGRNPDVRREPDGFPEAMEKDPCLLMRIGRALGEELERWRATRPDTWQRTGTGS